MKKSILLSLAIVVFARFAPGQQGFDFSSLDKLAAVAKDKTVVTLNGDMLKLAANFLGNDKDAASIKSMVGNLKGIYVREYEFEKEGQYTEADLASLRASLKEPSWNRIVESSEGRDSSEVWLQPISNNQLSGVVVISAEPKDLTVVYINGVMNMSDIAALSGNLGIPEFKLDRGGKKSGGKSDKAGGAKSK